jgi:hypothetical protein
VHVGDASRWCPAGRSFHSFTCTDCTADGGGATLVAHGGRNTTTVFHDTWCYFALLRRWVQLHDNGDAARPAQPRAYHAAVEVDGEVWLIGGKAALGQTEDAFLGDVAVVTPPSRAALRCAIASNADAPSAPAPKRAVAEVNSMGNRAYHAAALLRGSCSDDAGRPRIYCYGGFNGRQFIDVVSMLDCGTGMWSHYAPSLQPGAGLGVVVPSKCSTCGAPANCTHQSGVMSSHGFNRRLFSHNKLTNVADDGGVASMPPRGASSLVKLGDSFFVFGGEVLRTFFDSVFRVDVAGGVRWCPLSGNVEVSKDASPPRDTVSPAARAYHCSWPVGGRTVAVWGGYSSDRRHSDGRFFNDMCFFDPAANEWISAEQRVVAGVDDGENDDAGAAPKPRASAAIAATTGMRSYLFGGDCGGGEYFGDVWQIDVEDDYHDVQCSLKRLVAEFADSNGITL